MKSLRIALAACLALCLFLSIPAFAADYLTVSVTAKNAAPVAENLTVETYKGVTVVSSFRAHDPEGDSVTYKVSVEPKKGVVTVDGAEFSYVPKDGKSGKDTFKYVAIDSKGGVSGEATVTVEIKKQQTKVTYSDVSSYEAVFLAEKGVFLGEMVGGKYVFRPDETVSRGEFLAMCMDICGLDASIAVSRTGFSDDDAIPVWVKPYVSAAVIGGIVRGSLNENGAAVFRSGDAVTSYEAAVILDNALGITETAAIGDDAVPVWAQTSVSDLKSVDIPCFSGLLTRADAARMLTRAAKIVESREAKGLWSWLK
ncbi:MAG: surface layer protein [Oscillospiraceae bacterium]|nr:surface layer protein [Oscillospiraceae bacterium]